MFKNDIPSLLQYQAQIRPDGLAILAPGRAPLSYQELWLQVGRLSAAISMRDAAPGSRVAVALPNGPEMAVACLGAAMGFACVPLNPLDPEPELRNKLQETGVQLLVLDDSMPSALRSAALALDIRLLDIRPNPERPAGWLDIVVVPGQQCLDRKFAGASDTSLVFQTSGTTAKPKVVPLSHSNVVAVARNVQALYGLGPNDRCLNVMPMFHSHALVFAMLSCLAGGGGIVCAPRFDPHAFYHWIAEFQPTWYTAVPTIHQAVIQHSAQYRQLAPRHRFRFVASGSASLSPATLIALEAVVEAPVIESYGLSETATIFASNPMPPATRKPGSVGLPVASEIAIMDTAGHRLAQGATGEIAAKGPGVMSGYENNIEANAQAFVNGWLRTGDEGYLDADGYLFITGRIKEIVNRGGAKISPREIDDALLESPGVAQAVAFGFPHPTLGEDLAAAVVLKAGVPADAQGLRAWLGTRLADYKVPSRIVFVDEIPKTSAGKVQRISLHRKLIASATSCSSEPSTPSERLIAAIWCESLGLPSVGLQDNFFDLGGHSLLLMEVIARIHKTSGKQLHPTHLSLQSLEQAACLLDGLEPAPSAWRRLFRRLVQAS